MYSRKISRKLDCDSSNKNSRGSRRNSTNYSDTDSNSNSDTSQFDSDESLSEDDEREVSQGMIGEIFSNKYICLKYLGKGTFSRVWLVYDLTSESFYAMKVVYSKYSEDAEHEIEMYRELGNKYHNVTRFIDSFMIDSQICLVMELMGICLIDLFKYYQDKTENKNKYSYEDGRTGIDLIPIDIVKKIFKDLFCGLHELHRKNIVHKDLKPENIMINVYPNKLLEIMEWFNNRSQIKEMYLSKLNDLLPSNFNKLDSPKKKIIRKKARIKALSIIKRDLENIVLNYHKQIYHKILDTASNIIEIDDVSDLELEDVDYGEQFTLPHADKIIAKIIDLGNADLTEDFEPDVIQLRCYRPPENVLHDFYNTKADIWTMGCILFETLTGDYLFEIDHERYHDSLDRDKELLVQMYNVLGKFSTKDVSRSMYKDDLFIGDSNDISDVSAERFNKTSIKKLLDESNTLLDNNQREIVTDLFNKIFVYDIENRMDAQTVLCHTWFN